MDFKKEIPYFISQYWQWMISTLLIPLIGFIYKRYKKDKE